MTSRGVVSFGPLSIVVMTVGWAATVQRSVRTSDGNSQKDTVHDGPGRGS